MTRFGALAATIALLLVCSVCVAAQARPLITTSSESVPLPSVTGQRIVLGAVSLGRQRMFTMFNIQAAGTITPDPEMNGAAFQLQFLICDQSDCQGEIRRDARILPDAQASSPARVLVTRSFGVSTHNAAPVDLTGYKTNTPNGALYLVAAMKSLRSTGNTPFAAKLNLLRVDIMP